MNLHRAGRIEEARRLYQKALRRDPADADAINYLGILEFQRGAEEASVAYQRAIALDQQLPEAWYNLGVCQRRLQQLDAASRSLRQAIEARPDYAQWLAVDPHNAVARHMAAATTAGRGPARADDRYVSEHFDRFAASFDASLGALGYRAPQLVADALTRLAGVDLSEGMLAKARERRLYDELIAGELTAYLARCQAAFDVVISADTLCYFGDLETTVRAVIAATALEALALEQVVLRKEGDTEVAGWAGDGAAPLTRGCPRLCS